MNDHDEIVPQVAESVGKVEGLVHEVQPGEEEAPIVWDVKLKEGYMFSDGTEVTAQRVADALMEQNAKNLNARASLGKITATPQDDLTVRIKVRVLPGETLVFAREVVSDRKSPPLFSLRFRLI